MPTWTRCLKLFAVLTDTRDMSDLELIDSVNGHYDVIYSTYDTKYLSQYWVTRQPNPVHIQQLPKRCYALAVRYPLMVVGSADQNLVVFNLQNPQDWKKL